MAVENKDSNGMQRNRKEVERRDNRVKQRSRERENSVRSQKFQLQNPVGSLDMVYMIIH